MNLKKIDISELKNTQSHLNTVESGFIVNELYRVLIARTGKYTHIRIRRLDDKPIISFQDIQDIKNEFIGKKKAAIQVFPKETDYINNTNTYHIFFWENMDIPNLATLYVYNF